MKLKISDIAQDIDTRKKTEYADKKSELGTKSLISAQDATQLAVIEVGKAIIAFIGQHEPNVAVKNHPEFPKSILTPDVKAVVDRLNALIQATQTKEPDNSKIEVKLRDILEQMKQVPKEQMVIPEFPAPIDHVTVTNHPDWGPALDSIIVAIKAQKLDPKISVASPKVTVNNNELAKAIADMGERITTAVNAIDLTETAPDFTTLEKAIKRVEDAVHQIEIPIPSFPSIDKLATNAKLDELKTALTPPAPIAGFATETTLAKTVGFAAKDNLTITDVDNGTTEVITITNGVITKTITITASTGAIGIVWS
jgi:hypothetical protein